jgi:hypothetical protein
MDVHAALGHESNATLGVGRLVLGEVLELVIFEFEIADVAVTKVWLAGALY